MLSRGLWPVGWVVELMGWVRRTLPIQPCQTWAPAGQLDRPQLHLPSFIHTTHTSIQHTQHTTHNTQAYTCHRQPHHLTICLVEFSKPCNLILRCELQMELSPSKREFSLFSQILWPILPPQSPTQFLKAQKRPTVSYIDAAYFMPLVCNCLVFHQTCCSCCL